MAAEKRLDSEGEPYPWYTYRALEYQKQLDSITQPRVVIASASTLNITAPSCDGRR